MNDSAKTLGEKTPKETPPKSTLSGTRKNGESSLYLGFSLLLAYHYVLWFVDDSFFHTQFLDSAITNGWLGSLITTSFTMALVSFIRPGKRHLSDAKTLVYAVPVLTALSALAHGFSPRSCQALKQNPRWLLLNRETVLHYQAFPSPEEKKYNALPNLHRLIEQPAREPHR